MRNDFYQQCAFQIVVAIKSRPDYIKITAKEIVKRPQKKMYVDQVDHITTVVLSGENIDFSLAVRYDNVEEEPTPGVVLNKLAEKIKSNLSVVNPDALRLYKILPEKITEQTKEIMLKKII